MQFAFPVIWGIMQKKAAPCRSKPEEKEQHMLTLETLTAFFKWSAILNTSLLVLWGIMFLTASDMMYRMHKKWFMLSRETFDGRMYSFFGLYKSLLVFFNIIPYIALRLIGS